MKGRLIHPKVAKYSAVGGALGIIVTGLIGRIHGLDLTPAEGGAIAVVVGYVASFLPIRG